jgi:hypothetical protein
MPGDPCCAVMQSKGENILSLTHWATTKLRVLPPGSRSVIVARRQQKARGLGGGRRQVASPEIQEVTNVRPEF